MDDACYPNLRDIYLFWKWEYVKRCDVKKIHIGESQRCEVEDTTSLKDIYFGFRELTGKEASIFGGVNYRSYEIDLFKFIISESEVGRYFSIDSQSILMCILNNSLSYFYPHTELKYNAAMPLSEVVEDFQIFQNSPDYEVHMVTQEDVTDDLNRHGYIVFINPNAHIDEVIEDIKRIHTGSDTHQLEKRACIKLKGMCIENMNTPRAVGLWLWDYINNKYGVHAPKYGALAESINALKKNFDVSKLGYANSDKETFRKLYRRTKACIDSSEVLTLK